MKNLVKWAALVAALSRRRRCVCCQRTDHVRVDLLRQRRPVLHVHRGRRNTLPCAADVYTSSDAHRRHSVYECGFWRPRLRRAESPAPSVHSPRPGRCARAEGQLCRFTGTRQVRYGAQRGLQLQDPDRRQLLHLNTVFGDPAPGVPKSCEYGALVATGGGLPNGQVNTDIGAPAIAGSTSYSAGRTPSGRPVPISGM